MSKHATISEMDSYLMYKHPILICMSHDMAKIETLYDKLRDVLLEQDNTKITKLVHYFLKTMLIVKQDISHPITYFIGPRKILTYIYI